MEEKERYELFGKHYIKDNNPDVPCQFLDKYVTCIILNEQDKRIKELEATNKVLSNELTKNNIIKQDRLETCCGIPIYEISTLKEENQQLKEQLSKKEETLKHIMSGEYIPANIAEKTLKLSEQSQKQLAIEELEKLKEKAFHFYVNDTPELTSFYVDVKEIDNQIKSLKGEK